MREFKYDILELIELVRDRPCLWDKSCENYKDRLERKASWEEIFGALEKNYETMTREEKRLTGENIVYKWTNVRDTFVKSLKNKMGKPRKKYLYYNQLKFLMKHIPEESSSYLMVQGETDLHEEVTLKQDDDDEDDHDFDEGPSNYNVRKRSHNSYQDDSDEDEDNAYSEVKKKTKKSRCYVNDSKSGEVDPVSVIPDYVGVDENDPRVMNEDEAFFASLLPTVVKYDEDDRLEFRIEVLKVMKQIKDKRVTLEH